MTVEAHTQLLHEAGYGDSPKNELDTDGSGK